MYWPLGTPRIYAVTNERLPASRQLHSRDGLAPPEHHASEQANDKQALLSPSSAAAHELPLGPTTTPLSPTTPVTPITPAIKSVEYGEHDEGILGVSSSPSPTGLPPREPVLALQVARAGHIFAVITATSITIWQTKVRPPPFCAALGLYLYSNIPSS